MGPETHTWQESDPYTEALFSPTGLCGVSILHNFTDFTLWRLLVVDINSDIVLVYRVNVTAVFDVSEVLAASTDGVEVCNVGESSQSVVDASSRPVVTMEGESCAIGPLRAMECPATHEISVSILSETGKNHNPPSLPHIRNRISCMHRNSPITDTCSVKMEAASNFETSATSPSSTRYNSPKTDEISNNFLTRSNAIIMLSASLTNSCFDAFFVWMYAVRRPGSSRRSFSHPSGRVGHTWLKNMRDSTAWSHCSYLVVQDIPPCIDK
jgi:hypothetical protein